MKGSLARLRATLGRTVRRGDQDGQVIVLFALSLVALLLMGALVLDVARVYSVQQYQRSVTDAAALAGAQDLQVYSTTPTNAAPGSTEYNRAQCDAYNVLVRELTGSTSNTTCATLPNWVSGTPLEKTVGEYTVSITTPYQYAHDGDPSRAVKVAISRPFPLTFGNLVCLLPGTGCGASPVWQPGVASVADSVIIPQYALMTLQPDTSLCNGSKSDLVVSGGGSTGITTGTTLHIVTGAVGTNSTACTTNPAGAKPAAIFLEDGSDIYHYSVLPSGPTWYQVNGLPQGQKIDTLIPDPNYPWASVTSIPPAPPTDTGCSLPSDLTAVFGSAVNWTCYYPGAYSSTVKINGSNEGAYLTPGVYYFEQGLSVNSGSILAGGVNSGSEGVVLVFPESGSNNFSTNSSTSTVVLNTGDLTGTLAGGNIRASNPADPNVIAPTDASGKQLETPQGMLLTIEVLRDNSCFGGSSTSMIPQLCTTTHNQVVTFTGNPTILIGGVIYGPSDNMQITSNATNQSGIYGQIVSYTVSYGGGAQLNQEYPAKPLNTVLRLDTMCSPGVACP